MCVTVRQRPHFRLRALRRAAGRISPYQEAIRIIVRSVFAAKPGNASKLAAQFKTAAAAAEMPKYRVLTDLTGDFNRVILEYEVQDVGGFEAQMKEYATNESFRAAMKGYTDLYVTGSRELLQTV